MTYSQAFLDPEYRKATWVNVWNILFHELTGINVIFLYSNTILQTVLTPDSGFTPREGVYMISLVNTLSSGVGIYAMSTFGRRSLTLWGGIGIVAAHYAIGTFILTQHNIGTLLCMCLFIFFYQNSSGPVAWVYA